jgi:hypothetical protein
VAVTKRVRFEVFRRDGFKCRYCGVTASDGAGLTVDHVVPVSLGGIDKPSNLVTACKDCNAGKSSTQPDGPMVEDVSSSDMAFAAALKAALSETASDLAAYHALYAAAVEHWTAWEFGGQELPLPPSMATTMDHWARLGVTAELVGYAIDIAMSAAGVHKSSKWKYACGIVWKRVNSACEEITATDGGGRRDRRCGHCFGCAEGDAEHGDDACVRDSEALEMEVPCRVCGERSCLYQIWFTDGHFEKWNEICDTLDWLRNALAVVSQWDDDTGR